MRWGYKAFVTLGLALLLGSAALAQDDSCPLIVETALAAADELCADTGRNQVCYGHLALRAEAQPDAADFVLAAEGDITDVVGLKTLQLFPMNEATGEWGVAVMRLQANIPDTLPGQNVTFLLFGDVEITGADAEDTPPGSSPMQAFYLRTGVADSGCDEAPESGLLVQTPEGVGEVAFTVNGVDIQMGSTVLFQGSEEEDLSVSVLEGAALVSAGDGQQLIPAGTWARVPLQRIGARLLARSAPQMPESYEGRQALLEHLPLRLLQRRIEVKAALTREQINTLQGRIQAGELPCGEDPLPSCDRVRRFLVNRARVCMALPRRQRPAYCGDLRDFVTDIRATQEAREQITLTPPPGGESGVLPRGDVPASCSLNSDTPITILFVNNTRRTVSVYWKDFQCGEVLYHTLEPGQSYVQETYATHPWVVRDSATGEALTGLVGEASTTVQIGG